MQPPKAIIFDIGNVLIKWHPERLYDSVMSRDARRKMFSDVDLHCMNDKVDRGQNWRKTVYATADEYPEYRDMIRLWHDRWAEMATPSIDLSWEILRALKANNTPVFALSNFGIQTFAYAETLYPQLTEFDRRYISGHMGVTKPDPQIYEMVEKDCGLSGGEILFTDDRAENIDAAIDKGWQTHLFTTPEVLLEDLFHRNLLNSDHFRE